MAETKKVTRIKATDKKAADATKAKVAPAKAKKAAVKNANKKRKTPKKVGYFRGAWAELRLVRWPNRQATWALTLGVLLFSIGFLGLIILLDMFFKYLFELIIA